MLLYVLVPVIYEDAHLVVAEVGVLTERSEGSQYDGWNGVHRTGQWRRGYVKQQHNHTTIEQLC